MRTTSNKTNRSVGVVISWATIIVQVLISLVFTPFLIKMVGDRQYGLYSFSSSLISWLSMLLVAFTAGYHKFVLREQKEKGDRGEAITIGVFCKIYFALGIGTLVLGLAFDLLFFYEIIPLNEYSLEEKNQICILLLMSIFSTFFSTVLTATKSYPYYKQRFIFAYSISLIEIIARTIISFIALKIGLGILYVALIHYGCAFLNSLITTFVSMFVLKEKIILFSHDSEEKKRQIVLFKEIFFFSSFLIINVIADILNKNMDINILGFVNSDSVSTYRLALIFSTYLISFTSIVATVFAKEVAEAYYKKGTEGANELFLKVSKIQSIVALLLTGGFVCCGKEFVELWLGAGRENVYYIGAALMVVFSFNCSTTIAFSIRQLLDLHKQSAFITLGIVISNIVLSVLFVSILPRELAVFGCLGGTVISEIIGNWIIIPLFDYKKTGLATNVFVKKYFLSFTLTIVFALGVGFLLDLLFKSTITNLVLFFIKMFIFAVGYICFFFLTNKKLIISILRKRKTNFEKID